MKKISINIKFKKKNQGRKPKESSDRTQRAYNWKNIISFFFFHQEKNLEAFFLEIYFTLDCANINNRVEAYMSAGASGFQKKAHDSWNWSYRSVDYETSDLCAEHNILEQQHSCLPWHPSPIPNLFTCVCHQQVADRHFLTTTIIFLQLEAINKK